MMRQKMHAHLAGESQRARNADVQTYGIKRGIKRCRRDVASSSSSSSSSLGNKRFRIGTTSFQYILKVVKVCYRSEHQDWILYLTDNACGCLESLTTVRRPKSTMKPYCNSNITVLISWKR